MVTYYGTPSTADSIYSFYGIQFVCAVCRADDAEHEHTDATHYRPSWVSVDRDYFSDSYVFRFICHGEEENLAVRTRDLAQISEGAIIRREYIEVFANSPLLPVVQARRRLSEVNRGIGNEIGGTFRRLHDAFLEDSGLAGTFAHLRDDLLQAALLEDTAPKPSPIVKNNRIVSGRDRTADHRERVLSRRLRPRKE